MPGGVNSLRVWHPPEYLGQRGFSSSSQNGTARNGGVPTRDRREFRLGQHQTLCHRRKQKESRIAQNRARLSIDTYHAPLGLACKETPLQIGETGSIIERTKLVNSIPNRAHGREVDAN